jgi:hypothetical protein
MPTERRLSTRAALALAETGVTGRLGVDLGGAADAVGLDRAESPTLNAVIVSDAPDDTTVVHADEALDRYRSTATRGPTPPLRERQHDLEALVPG